MEYGLIGRELGHSLSPRLHAQIGEYPYVLCPLEPDELGPFLQRRAFRALNVTIPYKAAVIPYLDDIEPRAAACGAVNTIVQQDGRLIGYNTDLIGMEAALAHAGLCLRGADVLILGTGGTSCTARQVAQAAGAARITCVSRTGRAGAMTYEEACERRGTADLVLNTTPCGMFPQEEAAPLPWEPFPRLRGVWEAIYNPLRTQWRIQAAARGIPASGGLWMLCAQALAAARLFPGVTIRQARVEQLVGTLYQEVENIVLIGMPGVGKTTVGRLLAQKMHRPFYDADAVFCERFHTTPATYIGTAGEGAFRDREEEILRHLATMRGAVIATGGGCVLRQRGIDALRRSGRLYLLDRPLGALRPTLDRPLSQDRAGLEALYCARWPLYLAAADCRIPEGTPAAMAAAIEREQTGRGEVVRTWL